MEMTKTQLPNSAEVEQELNRERYKSRYKRTLWGTVFALVTAAAAAVLVATLWLPVLQIFGGSMSPTLQEDIVAFYYGNKVLVKRYIAGPGTWVDIREDGTVLLNGQALEEPYLTEKHFGICDLEFPYQVPEGTYFLMGDERETSVDSRHSSVGCITMDQIVGKIVYRVWPLDTFGTVR